MTPLEALMTPTVLAAMVAGIVTVVVPWVSARIKRQQNGRVEQIGMQVRRLDADQQMLDRLEREIERHQIRLHELEKRERELHDALIMVEAELTVLHDKLEELGHADLARYAVRVLEQIRRGRGVPAAPASEAAG